MPKIPDTFCPAKWDELYVSFEMNYAYSCCKSKTTRFTDTVLEFVDQERYAMLQGQQDPSCDYCWTVERNGGTSLRHAQLEKFNSDDFKHYQDNKAQPKLVQVSVGNECNLQCTYCNPKFSSQWEHDVRDTPYTVFSDRFFYAIDSKQSNVMDRNIEFLKGFDSIDTLSVIGGEPLFNKKFFELINTVIAHRLDLSTNLSVKRDTLSKFLSVCGRFESVNLRVSIDATEQIAEFVRYGLNYKDFCDNLDYMIAHAPPNLKITIGSVMSSITVRDIDNFKKKIIPMLSDQVRWQIDYCHDPKIQSMHTLPDHYKSSIISAIEELETLDISGASMLKSVVANTQFNRILHQELKHFMQEFSSRKNIEIPLCLD
jgi:pyruvate-formate lyase-activating enzyme